MPSSPDNGGSGQPTGSIAELEREIAGYRARNSALKDQIRRKEEEAVFVAKEALAAQKKLRDAQALIADMEGGTGGKADEGAAPPEGAGGEAASLRDELEERAAEHEASGREYEQRLESLGAELEAKESELEAFRTRESELESELVRTRGEIADRKREIGELGDRLGKGESDRELLRERLEEKESELGALEGKLALLQAVEVESEELKKLNARLAAKVGDIVARLVRLSTELEERELEIGRIKSRLEDR